MEQLQEEEQKQIAHLLLQEISWEESFRKSQDQLSTLADKAIRKYKAGKTTHTA